MPNGPKLRQQGGTPTLPGGPMGSTGMDRIAPQRVTDMTGASRQAAADEIAALAAEAELTSAELATETRDRQEAQYLGLDYDTEYRLLPPRVRGLLSYAAAPQEEVLNPWENPQVDATFGFSGRPAGTMSREEFQKFYQTEPDYDPKTYVLLLRRPQPRVGPDGVERLYHVGGWQVVSRRDLPRKIKEGWSTTPRAPFLPDPAYPCEVRFMGISCSVKCLTPGDVDTHMRHYHPEEFAVLEARRARSAVESSQDTQSLTNEALVALLKKLTDAPELPAPNPEDGN